MKRVLFFITVVSLLSSCGGSGYYQMTESDKESQRGYHVTQTQKTLDKNEKNKEANKKGAEKAKAEQNAHLNALNKNKAKGTAGNPRTFKFY
jgi:hypothetical protein